MNVANSVLWRMATILKANKVNLFVSSVLFVFWYHSPNFLDTPHMIVIGVLSEIMAAVLAWRTGKKTPHGTFIYASVLTSWTGYMASVI
jgi:hypothetical protein